MSRLRVAFDATPLLGAKSGIGWFTDELLGALAHSGRVDLVAYGLAFRSRKMLTARVPPGVRVADRWFSILPLRGAWLRTNIPPVEWWTGRVDVVHGTNFLVPPARRAAEVVTVHDLTAWRFPEMVHADSLSFPALVERAVARGAWVHTNSEAVAEEVRAEYPSVTDRVVVVAPGVPDVAQALPGAGRALAGRDRYLLALGTIEPRKDLVALVRAFDALATDDPDVGLVLAGADGWGADAVHAAIAAATNRDRVVTLGYVDDGPRAALLRDASVLAYPSVYEGFGFPPLEAMSVGTPVVASRAGSLPEVCGDAALFVDVGDVDALADALARALDPATAQHLAEVGSANIARFSWDDTVDGMLRLYASATASVPLAAN